jgi:hypothetical protein
VAWLLSLPSADIASFDVPQTRDLKMVPTIFSATDMPQNYNFEANPLFMKDENTGEWVLKKQKKTTSNWAVGSKVEGKRRSYFILTAEIPSAPPYALRKDLLPVYKRLKELFEQRPIWLKSAVSMNVPKEMVSKIQVAFAFMELSTLSEYYPR